MKRRRPARQEKQLLEYQVKVLKKNLYGTLPGAPHDGKAQDLLSSGTVLGKKIMTGNDKRTIYEKYRRLWRQDVGEEENKIFEQG